MVPKVTSPHRGIMKVSSWTKLPTYVLQLALMAQLWAKGLGLQLQQPSLYNCAARSNSLSSYVNPRRRPIRQQIRMDDEVSRPGIKEELTTRDDYLATRFTKLSASGHDLTPLTPEEVEVASSHLPVEVRAALLQGSTLEENPTTTFTNTRDKGLYACAVGGLPLFTSGWKLAPRVGDTCPSFAEPCDEEHVLERRDEGTGITRVLCSRSRVPVGIVIDDVTSPSGRRYLIPTSALDFYPFGTPLPVRCQPENYWGSEGQYRVWDFDG